MPSSWLNHWHTQAIASSLSSLPHPKVRSPTKTREYGDDRDRDDGAMKRTAVTTTITATRRTTAFKIATTTTTTAARRQRRQRRRTRQHRRRRLPPTTIAAVVTTVRGCCNGKDAVTILRRKFRGFCNGDGRNSNIHQRSLVNVVSRTKPARA